MKTLKKTLCLVLAVVMVLGLCVMSASADLEYTDNDKITYKEAVDVMSGIGVLKGDERGFRPTDSINRAEAAKIIAYLLVGNATQADALKANTDPFTDVPATHWAAGYISYCVNAGVINGMGDGTFAPNDPVTGLQFAKMLLCALGYNANDEYVNSDWTISVSKDALRLGMFDKNLAGATNTPATREECALYAFNTVAGANDYKGIAKVSYSALLGGYITGLGTGTDAADANKERTFAKDFELDKNVEDQDAFGRMTGHNWYVKTKGNIISDLYADSGDLKATYNGKVTYADIVNLLGKSFVKDVDPDDYEVWINGIKQIGNAADIDKDDIEAGKKDAIVYKVNDGTRTAEEKIGNGTETLVYAGIYYDRNNQPYSWMRIVVVDTYLAKVNTVRKATSSRDADVSVALVDAWDDDANNTALRRDLIYGTDAEKIKTDEFARNDYVLVTIADGVVKTIEKAPTVESTVSRYNKTGDKITFTAAGTDYVAAKNTAQNTDLTAADNNDTTNDGVNNNVVNGKKHTLYVDKYGYLIAVADVEVDTDYVYAAHFGDITSHGDFDSTNIGVKLYYADGTSKIVTLNLKDADEDGDNYFVDNSITKESIDDDYVGIYKLTMKNGKAILSDNNKQNTAAITDAAEKQVKKGVSRLFKTAAGNTAADDLRADSKTVFFYVTPNKDWDEDDFAVKTYVGINAVRNSKDTNATIDSYIVADNGSTNVDAVLVDDGDEGSLSDTVYLYYGNVTVDDEEFTATYPVYVKGEATELVVKYEDYDKMVEGVKKIRATEGTFFTLDTKNNPITTRLVKDDNKPKKIDGFFYDDDLTVSNVSDKADDFYFEVTGDAYVAGYHAWSYSDTLFIDVTGNKDVLESVDAIKDAIDNDGKTVTVAVQYEDNNSNKAAVVYITDVQ